ncbi:MAG: hypothetical protein EBT34_11415, partial [Acetobacteraceae bacterium]|nr:hypothetical protein [Acetobacteraceae bacterium]
KLARLHGAASCAAPVSDTLKRADAKQFVCGGVDRTGVWRGVAIAETAVAQGIKRTTRQR